MSFYQRAICQGVKRLFCLPRLALPVLISLGFTLAAVLTVIAMASNLVFKPLPDIHDEQRIYHIDKQAQLAKDLNITLFTDHSRAELANFIGDSGHVASLLVQNSSVNINETPFAISAMRASHDFQTHIADTPLLLGERPTLDNVDNAVWISESLWQSAFAKSPSVIGQSLSMTNSNLLIRGVFADFQSYASSAEKLPQQTWQFYDLLSHLKDKPSTQFGGRVTLYLKLAKATSSDQVTTIETTLDNFWQYYQTKYESQLMLLTQMLKNTPTRTVVEPLREQLMKDQNTLIAFLLLAVSLVLVMASLNLFNLFLAHYQQRTSEFATQLCLGATPHRLAKMAFLENLPLFLLSAVIGVLTSAWLIRALPIIADGNIRMLELVHLDVTTVSAALLVVLCVNLLFSCSVMFQCNPNQLTNYFNTSNKGIQGAKMGRMSKALFIMQLSSAAIIITGTALLAGTTYSKFNVDLGFDPGNTLTIAVELEENPTPMPTDKVDLNAHIQQRAKAMVDTKTELINTAMTVQPEITALASNDEPFGKNMMITMNVDDETNQQFTYILKFVGSDYVPAFKLKLLTGRNITLEEQQTFAEVALVNKSLALQLTQGADVSQALGKQIGDLQIIGVIEDHYSMINRDSSYPILMTPSLRNANTGVLLQLQLPNGTAFKQDELASALRRVNPRIKQLKFLTLEQIWQEHTNDDRVRFYFTIALCGLTLLLAFVGSHAMAVSFGEIKRFELAVRMAIGASRKTLLKLTLNGIMPLLLSAVGTGLVVSTVGYFYIKQAFATAPELSFLSLSLFAGMLLVIVLGAISWVIWRVINTDPMRALREL